MELIPITDDVAYSLFLNLPEHPLFLARHLIQQDLQSIPHNDFEPVSQVGGELKLKSVRVSFEFLDEYVAAFFVSSQNLGLYSPLFSSLMGGPSSFNGLSFGLVKGQPVSCVLKRRPGQIAPEIALDLCISHAVHLRLFEIEDLTDEGGLKLRERV